VKDGRSRTWADGSGKKAPDSLLHPGRPVMMPFYSAPA
jgi:hypothetical protein